MRNSKIGFRASHIDEVFNGNYDRYPLNVLYHKEKKIVTIRNCMFLNDFEYRNPYSSTDRGFVFEECIFQAIIFENYSNINFIQFKSCEFKGDFQMTGLVRDLSIEDNCNFILNCIIQSREKKTLSISNSSFGAGLSISGLYKNINLSGLDENATAKAKSNLTFRDLTVTNSTFENLQFSKISFSDNCCLYSEGNFISVSCEEFSVNHTLIGLLIHFMGCNIKHFSVDNIKTEPRDNLHRYLKFSNQCSIGHASIALHMLESTEIEHSSFDEIRLWGTNSSTSSFKITNCSLGKFSLVDAVNRGTIALRDILLEKSQVLEFLNSDLGKMEFIKCDFSKGILSFQNSKIMEVFLAVTDFPREVTTDGKINHSQARLVFGQLQTAFQKQGDTVRSIEYQSREIEAHYKDIKLFTRNFLTVVNLWLNLISNFFGRWWGLGILFTFGVGMIGYWTVLFSTDGFRLSFSHVSTEGYADSFWKFMNPLRHFDTKSLFEYQNPKIKPTGWSYFFDYFSRVLVTYGYYQTIQAFRRYGRK